MKDPAVSIIIPSWNARGALTRCLGSVFRHTAGICFEVIVVDNGSVDGSAEMVEQRFPKASLIRNDFNAGFAAACNVGLRSARGEKVLLLNSDTVVSDNAIREMSAFLDQHPWAGVAGCALVREDGSRQRSAGREPGVLNEAVEKLVQLKVTRKAGVAGLLDQRWLRRPRAVDWVSGAFLMTSKTVISRIGLLHEGFFLYFEDIEWCVRARDAGYQILYNPAVRVVHVGGQSVPWPGSRCGLDYRRSQLLFYLLRHGNGANLWALRAYLAFRGSAGAARGWVWQRMGREAERGAGSPDLDFHRDLLKLAFAPQTANGVAAQRTRKGL